MDGIVCPYCQKTPDDSELWARPADETSTIQLLLDGGTEPASEQTGEELEFITTLHPCGHSFPHDSLKSVEKQIRILDELRERHKESTNPFEQQLLRGDIHSIRQQLSVETERCKEEMDE